MWPLSTQAHQALSMSHGVTSRVVVQSPDFGILTIPISGGSVTADATSQVRRTATITAPYSMWPESPTDILSPFGSVCQIDYGIGLPGGAVEWVPLGTFSLDEAQRERPVSNSGDVTVNLVDNSARVAEDRLDAPTQTQSGKTAVEEITRLVQDSLGSSIQVIDLTGNTDIAARIEIDKERWGEGIEKLAESIGAEVFFDQLNRLVIRPQPTTDQPHVWVIRTGSGGNLLTQKEIWTREKVYNKVVAFGQRSDDIPPVRAAVTDDDPSSPTRYGGPFGKKPRFYSSPLLTTTAQCTTAAQSILDRVKGLSAKLAVSTMVNPALEPGDVVLVDDSERGPSLHILDTVVTPLTATEPQSLESRSAEIPEEA